MVSNGLDVNISPELWLEIDGKKHVIKLYFKSDALSQIKADLILRLMDREVGQFGKVVRARPSARQALRSDQAAATRH